MRKGFTLIELLVAVL
ncbi:prepilin-type N-terminal cleavage/methylation domain-containing protein [Elusimicrobium minutum]